MISFKIIQEKWLSLSGGNPAAFSSKNKEGHHIITGNDAADQIVRYTLEGTEIFLKLSGSAAKNAALFLNAVLKDQKKTRGKTTVARMLREGKELKFFPVPTNQLHQFAKEAKQYGLLFVAMKHKGNLEAETDVMVFTHDAPKVNRIMDRLELARVDTGAVEAEILRDQEQGEHVNFTQAQSNTPFENSSHYRNGLLSKHQSAGADDRSLLPSPERPIMITDAPPERLALPERTDGVIVQPPPRGMLALPAPEEERPSVREELAMIEKMRAQKEAQDCGRGQHFERPQHQRKKKISKSKAR